ncbi:Arabidopsis Toxicos en Levadura 72, DAF-Like gene 1 [Hibiscus trionum]|uniref:RING-type E3 ubiquitin transferase n=1 Tax=Hibiscus trionum TaxID=183268 RepID=A0A9W7J5K1_HIBTR|nr:Arabidopsis Toxicos en Levadura 72, DAF-Like gene 1 [Hibiscus trionum]
MLSATVNLHRRLLETEVSLPPGNGNKTHDSYISETTFDTNMVVILAALLCALICALGLNSMVRCALRCSRRFATETPEQEAARLATTGLKKRDLKQIPVAVYGEGVSFPSTECPICLGEFVGGEKVRVLPKCNHGFHVRCIDTWLLSHSSCPNCRHSLLELKASKTETSRSARQPENGIGDHQNGSVAVVVE